jgi:uncharacterized flavoprotein (TIGR03862 family)
MAAEVLIEAGFKIDLYDAMPSVGRKFLMAGKGGMNISNNEPSDLFLSRYGGRSGYMKNIFNNFTPADLRHWLHELGIETIIGTSGRVFPSDMKAAPLLRKWLLRLRAAGVILHMRHRWMGWVEDKSQQLIFNVQGNCIEVKADAVILALGGASWPQLGSTGEWVSILAKQGVSVAPVKSSNCGFESIWSEYFRKRYSGQPLKSIGLTLSCKAGVVTYHKGELIITEYGLEGGIIYTLSAILREEIALNGYAIIYLDLIPNISKDVALIKLKKCRGKQSTANQLRKQLGIKGAKVGLLRELVQSTYFSNDDQLCAVIKSLPIKLIAARPIAEAISSAGGVELTELDHNLMLINKPSIFCTGEMLDWEAPTGGYLLTACLSLGRAAGKGVIAYLDERACNLMP